VLTRPTILKLLVPPGRLFKSIGFFNLLPPSFRKMGQMLPSSGPLWPAKLPDLVRARTQPPKATVSFLSGCIGSVIYDRVNRMAVELLAASGADVYVSPNQGCCGAIHHHNGEHDRAMALARHNIDALLSPAPKVDYIVSTIAGCGAMLREYDVLLRDDLAYRDRARQFSSKVRDISEVLLELGLPEMKYPVNETITYHDACHLAHAQKVTSAPRKLLSQIPGLKVVPLPESDLCCGAAGTYNLTQPEMATQLADRKLKNIAATDVNIVAAGNVGCAMHIQSEADLRHQKLRIVHPVELLHRAVFGPS
jgi:glycolate oxidase iron-sulfur subunit